MCGTINIKTMAIVFGILGVMHVDQVCTLMNVYTRLRHKYCEADSQSLQPVIPDSDDCSRGGCLKDK